MDTCGTGYSMPTTENLRPRSLLSLSLYFSAAERTALVPSRCGGYRRRTYFILRIERIEVKKKYRLMTQDNRHNREIELHTFTSSYRHKTDCKGDGVSSSERWSGWCLVYFKNRYAECRVGYLPNLRSGDNLLADNQVQTLYDYGTELKKGTMAFQQQ